MPSPLAAGGMFGGVLDREVPPLPGFAISEVVKRISDIFFMPEDERAALFKDSNVTDPVGEGSDNQPSRTARADATQALAEDRSPHLLQCAADELDPELIAVGIDGRDHIVVGRSSSAAKGALADFSSSLVIQG